MDLEIDLEKVIISKNPKIAKFLPKFLLNSLKKLIHQDEINFFLKEYSDKEGTEFIGEILGYINVCHNSYGVKNIPVGGRYVFASNHPLGGLDGMLLAYEIARRFGSVKLVVNDLLMNLAPLTSIFVPVNKFGRQSTDYAKSINKLFSSQEQIIFFPYGLCSRRINGKIQDGEWKKNFVAKAIESERDIVPVFVDSQNSPFFYNLARFRKRMGIKVNFEMILLPKEFFKKRNSCINIYFGKPIPWQSLREKDYKQCAEEIRTITYSLKDDI
ncbi:MAG: 1-acyl-sn-glycerol-3-phosphate acyltransferase [Rikenellaceae bacterium]|nr:1-acyl-sn-glycerol-3-phosphate acyltransferase [Rikenellaceae bacterium]